MRNLPARSHCIQTSKRQPNRSIPTPPPEPTPAARATSKAPTRRSQPSRAPCPSSSTTVLPPPLRQDSLLDPAAASAPLALGPNVPSSELAPKKPAKKRGRPRKPIISDSKFQPAPLSSADWERIAARLAANWKAHFTAENVKLQAQNPGNPRKSLLIDLGNLASSWSDRPTATSHKDTPSQNSAPSDEVVAAQKAAGTHKAMAAWRAAAAREKISAVKSKVPTRRSSRRVS
ncbi:hypothetical protein PtB15_8B497 [Puccinia triticina]|nr:hypothetical protein PtB15_8B497 [Puccinia triticina]